MTGCQTQGSRKTVRPWSEGINYAMEDVDERKSLGLRNLAKKKINNVSPSRNVVYAYVCFFFFL